MGLLGKIRSILSRGTLNNPDCDDVFSLAGSQSNSGVSVNYKTVLKYSAIWRGLTLISNAVSGLPIDFYKNTDSGKEKDKRHPAYKLLRRQPNREMNIVSFISAILVRSILRGNGYAYIFRNGAGNPEEIMLLDPDTTYPVKEGGVLLYATHIKDRLHKLEPDDVIHIKGLSESGLMGLSLVEHAKNALGLSMAMEEHASKFFSNNAVPKVVIEHPNHFTSAETRNQFRKEWERAHRGIDNAYKTAVLENGIKVSPFSVNNRDSQFLEGRAFQIKDAANWLNLPPHKLGDESRTAYASLEQENQAYLNDSINGWLIRLEAEFWSKLLSKDEQDNETHTIEFNRNAIVRADINARFSSYAIAIQNRIMSPNEVRSRENMNSYEGGDDFLIPLNMGTTEPQQEQEQEQEPSQKQSPQEENNAAASEEVRRLVGLCVSRLLTRISTQAKKAAKKADSVRDWIESVSVDDSMLDVAIEAQAKIRGDEIDIDSARKIVENNIREWLRSAIGTNEAEFKQLKMNAQKTIIEALNRKVA